MIIQNGFICSLVSPAASCSRGEAAKSKPAPSGNYDLGVVSAAYHPADVTIGTQVIFTETLRDVIESFITGRNNAPQKKALPPSAKKSL